MAIKHWLITGDTHGLVVSRLENLGKTDYPPEETAIIILGDAGLNFYLNKTDIKNKRNINALGYRIYCLRGNHEQRPEKVAGIHPYMDEDVNGLVLKETEYDNIRYLMDGGKYNIGGLRTICIGGAYSVDKWYRLSRAGVHNKLDPDYFNPKKTGWFPDEQLTEEEMSQIENSIKGKIFDLVLTHTCPISWEPTDLFISGLDQSTVDKSMESWLNDLKDQFKWKIWLFAHYHDDRLVRPRVEMYYHDIEDLDKIWIRWQKPDELDWWLQKDPNYYMGV